jgi:hypothetical protein
MRKKLHPIVLTVAICQLLLGVFGLACDGLGLFGAASLYAEDDTGEPPSMPEPQGQRQNPVGEGAKVKAGAQPKKPQSFGDAFDQGMEAGNLGQEVLVRKAPAYRPFGVAEKLFGLFLSVLMIVSGVGLLFMQSWGRWLAVAYGALSIPVRLCGFGYHAAVVLPILNDLCRTLERDGNGDMVHPLWGLRYGPILGLLLMLYPLCVIILMLRPGIARAFRGELAPEADRGDFPLRRPDFDRYGFDERFRD